ncbi:interleukin-15 receptor subunit alpha isoform X1 [Leuresthes tenuis]|uniref:interleukin-15 receptor subunit alpha isoform X1 n=1 Tax=Leuresthes tenuis TaxID=355514 RepID=UPI003B50C676
MDRTCFILFFCLMMVYLLGCARLSSGAPCPCPHIPERPLTIPPPQVCHHINSSFRYTCIEHYVRKAGTSNLIKCMNSNGSVVWTTFKLECIPDPKITTNPPNSTAETSTTVVWSVSTSVSTSGGTNSVEPTPQVTTVNTCTIKSSMLSPTSSGGFSAPAPHFETNVKAAAISLSVVIMICALTGLTLCMYRRRVHRNCQQQKVDELQPMNRTTELEMQNMYPVTSNCHRGAMGC